jgi:hypothetical protein
MIYWTPTIINTNTINNIKHLSFSLISFFYSSSVCGALSVSSALSQVQERRREMAGDRGQLITKTMTAQGSGEIEVNFLYFYLHCIGKSMPVHVSRKYQSCDISVCKAASITWLSKKSNKTGHNKVSQPRCRWRLDSTSAMASQCSNQPCCPNLHVVGAAICT